MSFLIIESRPGSKFHSDGCFFRVPFLLFSVCPSDGRFLAHRGMLSGSFGMLFVSVHSPCFFNTNEIMNFTPPSNFRIDLV